MSGFPRAVEVRLAYSDIEALTRLGLIRSTEIDYGGRHSVTISGLGGFLEQLVRRVEALDQAVLP